MVADDAVGHVGRHEAHHVGPGRLRHRVHELLAVPDEPAALGTPGRVGAEEPIVVLRGVRVVARDDAGHLQHRRGRLALLRERVVLEPGRDVAVLVGEVQVARQGVSELRDRGTRIAIVLALDGLLAEVPVAVRPDSVRGRSAERVLDTRGKDALEGTPRLRGVVGGDDDQRVVEQPARFQCVDDPADLLVRVLRDERQVAHLLHGPGLRAALATVLRPPHVAELVDPARG